MNCIQTNTQAYNPLGGPTPHWTPEMTERYVKVLAITAVALVAIGTALVFFPATAVVIGSIVVITTLTLAYLAFDKIRRIRYRRNSTSSNDLSDLGNICAELLIP